ncbi:LANO_0C07998g1_1 [Lachancea nothofagi CBS 11611]|uniref:Elongin-A n=1 Tax=Lachancea nothofagi CBS 11611 TaxID=1266666 RepID=A0A1G4J8W6_9SACH|nr:LANO_0C07998g1_1 [Lachancea nothofagi CBS 11611]
MSGQESRIQSLSSLCEITLMRNHLMLQNVANMPYRLIRNVLMKLKMDHLRKLEETNVSLIFEDDEVWLELLKKDYSLHVHESFHRKRDKIVEFYISFVEAHDPAFLQDMELIKSFLRFAIKKDSESQRYRVPSRMLYFTYQEDTLRKQELSTQRLRLRMQQLQQEKEKNQIVPLEDPVYCERKTKGSGRSNDRSGPYIKSYKEHQKRQQHFRSGGFDATTKPVKRVAFGGQAGTPASQRNEAEAHHAEAKGISKNPSASVSRSPVQSQVKRPATPPRGKKPSSDQNPFLKRRKPIPRLKSKASCTPPILPSKDREPVVVKLNSTKINKKSTRSSIFAAPTPQEMAFGQDGNKPNAYIFDSSQR